MFGIQDKGLRPARPRAVHFYGGRIIGRALWIVGRALWIDICVSKLHPIAPYCPAQLVALPAIH